LHCLHSWFHDLWLTTTRWCQSLVDNNCRDIVESLVDAHNSGVLNCHVRIIVFPKNSGNISLRLNILQLDFGGELYICVTTKRKTNGFEHAMM
jgi:hypothetical protein